ncbi:zonular occludens toxin domain-containing protein [Kordia jejudonensis]|uniref:zonular occludens toxin domain-containing protein n=1 Tax=Kordia jejudonensis TaxID=1348245 RepID=UPI000629B152|nr:zonular occludens toxin domain-containing protein [Kordia jejudonensis]
MLVCGETGVGKTYRNKQEIKHYMMDHLAIGKKGRKVLAFDTNDDDYPSFVTVSPNHLKALTKVSARRIRPFNTDGSPMDNEDKKEVIKKIMKSFKNGLVVLDDIDHYMTGAKGQAMIGALCTVRHKGIDIVLTHQSVAKITTSEWQNCTWLRLHHQVDDVTRYRDRIPKYEMVRIAQLIVDEQYELASAAFAKGNLSEHEYKVQKSFFVYVNMREQRIVGCGRAAFIRACKKYIDQEEGKKVRMLLSEEDFDGNKIYQTKNDAIIKMITDKLRYHDNS